LAESRLAGVGWGFGFREICPPDLLQLVVRLAGCMQDKNNL
jgi:hypothetical protein